jgi:serine phosphatase RsbU (regulator of sigma subunit)
VRRRFKWFYGALAAGVGLSVLLLVEEIRMYRYVSGHLIPDHLNRLAGLRVSWLESRVREQRVSERGQLGGFLEELRRNHPDVAWVRVFDQQGVLLGASTGAPTGPLPADAVRPLVEVRAQSVTQRRGELLIVALPFRYRFFDQETPAGPGRPRFNLAEVGLTSGAADESLGPLRRNLAIALTSAIALLASMGIFALRFPGWLRAKELDKQLALARSVQQELLPKGCPACTGLDFVAECLPAWEVGGDYYDIFPTGQGSVMLVLGDVCGKGLPAALLMGLVHGAVRGAARSSASDLAALARQLNELLCQRTAGQRFVSLFWASCDPARNVLEYVNAGHLPPLLVRNGAVERLGEGGPVLGLLPQAPYQQAAVPLHPGDLLVVYSDGLIEAVNARGDEFGEERLEAVVQAHQHRPVAEVRTAIVASARAFTGPTPLPDDLTLLVARVTAPSP